MSTMLKDDFSFADQEDLMMSFYDRYAKCCKDAGIKPSSQKTAEQIGCDRSNISSLSKSGITPKGDIVAGAARMLNISADYLLGIIDTPMPINHSPDLDELEILELVRNLTDDDRKAAIKMLKGMAAMNEKKKK